MFSLFPQVPHNPYIDPLPIFCNFVLTLLRIISILQEIVFFFIQIESFLNLFCVGKIDQENKFFSFNPTKVYE